MLLNQYLPPFLTQTKTFTALINSEQIEIDGIENSAQDIINQCFIETATWGLAYWESFVGIETDVSKDLEYRRSCVLSKIRGVGTVSVNLIQLTASSFSNGQVDVVEHPSEYSFEIEFVGTRGIPPNMSDLQAIIEQIKPAHLAVIYTFTYITWNNIETYNHTWDQWDAKKLTWDAFETYKE